VSNSRYERLGCWVARRAWLVLSTLEDIQKHRIAYEAQARAYGEGKVKRGQRATYVCGPMKKRVDAERVRLRSTKQGSRKAIRGNSRSESNNPSLANSTSDRPFGGAMRKIALRDAPSEQSNSSFSFGTSEISFSWLAKRRRVEEYKLKELLSRLSLACPLWPYVKLDMHGGCMLWAFLICRATPFLFNTKEKMLAYLADHTSKSGKRYKNIDGKRLLRFRTMFRVRETKDKTEYYHMAMNLYEQLKKKHPDYTETHLKKLAWYKLWFQELLPGFYDKALVLCSKCHNRDDAS